MKKTIPYIDLPDPPHHQVEMIFVTSSVAEKYRNARNTETTRILINCKTTETTRILINCKKN